MIDMTNYTRAVTQRGTNIAVSASAGCGKTTTMINRIADLIINENAEITDFLVVTFTRAAAQEMLQKLKRELKKRCLSNNGKACDLSSQIDKAELADISTIHSFCTKICREYFNVADIPPDFTVMEETRSFSYKSKAMQRLIEQSYQSGDSDFFELSHIFGNRGDEGIAAAIDSIYNLISTLPDERDFVERVADSCCNPQLNQNPAAIFLSGELMRFASSAHNRCVRLAAKTHKAGLSTDTSLLKEIAANLLQFSASAPAEKNISALRDILNTPFTLKAIPRTSGNDIKQLHEKVRAMRDDIIQQLKKFDEAAADMLSPQRESNLAKLKVNIQALIRITLDYRDIYLKLKKKDSLLDFNDLEYYTHKILSQPLARQAITDRYKYIFIDEFQDTNRIQDAIIENLKNGNVFIVGDKKQSIYGFRGADSEIFTEKLSQPEYLGLTLSRNFRSERGILDFVNIIFSKIMTPEFSKISYAAEDMLTGDKECRILDGQPPVIIATAEPETREEKPLPEGCYSVARHAEIIAGSRERQKPSTEAAAIASAIKQLILNKAQLSCTESELNERKLSGKDSYVCYDDITILVRTKRRFTEKLYKDLLSLNIPVSAEFSYSLSEYSEITALVEFLKIIDNPLQDIELAAVLRSMFVALTEDELSLMRLAYPREQFCLIPQLYVNSHSDGLADKLKTFLQKLEDYRELSHTLHGARLLQKIAGDHNYFAYLSAKGDDGQDMAHRAESFIQAIFQSAPSLSLRQLLSFIAEAGDKIKLSPRADAGGSKVHLLTVHNSKGLEYPVVFLAGCGENFLFLDSRNKLICDRAMGLAMDIYDYESRTTTASFTRGALATMQNRRQVREEINILYVAMTRAKYRLYITGELNVQKFSPLEDAESIKYARCYLDLVLSPLPEFYDEHYPWQNSQIYKLITGGIDPGHPPEKVLDSCADRLPAARPLSGYKYMPATSIPLKNTVTARAAAMQGDLPLYDIDESASRQFIHKHNLAEDRIETGNAYHKLLEIIDFGIQKNEIKQFIEQCGLLSKQEKTLIDNTLVEKLWDTEIFRLARTHTAHREKSFMLSTDASNLGYGSNEKVLVQGIVDMLIITPDGAIIADYKFSTLSDRLILQRYKPQLKLYRDALQQILSIPVVSCCIIQVPTAKVIKVF